MKRHLPAGILISIVLAGSLFAGTVGAAGAKAKPSTFEGRSCTEAMAFFFREPAALAPFLPDGFTPREVFPRFGELLVMITRCEAGVVNGKPVGATLFSEIGIYIEDPKELAQLDHVAASGFQYYQVWHLTDEDALRRALAKVGIDGAMVRDATFDSPSVVQTEADMPWTRVPYSLTSLHPANRSSFASRPSTFWHVGKKGVVATTYRSVGDRYRTGATQLTTPADGMLAEMMDSPSGIADQGVVVTYDKLTAQTVLVTKRS